MSERANELTSFLQTSVPRRMPSLAEWVVCGVVQTVPCNAAKHTFYNIIAVVNPLSVRLVIAFCNFCGALK